MFREAAIVTERITRAERVRQIIALRAEGLTQPQIAERLGVSVSGVRNIINDPDGGKQRARRDTYTGTCEDCGGPTRSDGTSRPSPVCADCSHARQHADKRWTVETVIDAIQRFAADHGRAPTADEWITADFERGYPSRSSVYQANGHNPSAPFPQWADAIAAAGFPRPTSGRRTLKEIDMQDRSGYVVLRETPEGLWEIVHEGTENTQIQALNAALNGHNPESGRWLAIPGRSWRPRALKPRTIYDFFEETTAA
jgi:hypothetical protein